MTNQEQRTKIEKLLNEIEESATDLTAEQQEALLVVRSITGIAFDLSDDMQNNPTEAVGNMMNSLEEMHEKVTDLRMSQFPSGGIVGAVVPGELHGGEIIINKE